jgi:hypothetical protein
MQMQDSDTIVEVFRTNVVNRDQADRIVLQIQNTFMHYKAHFDLEDCDRILVVKCTNGEILPSLVVDLLYRLGFHAEILPDE